MIWSLHTHKKRTSVFQMLVATIWADPCHALCWAGWPSCMSRKRPHLTPQDIQCALGAALCSVAKPFPSHTDGTDKGRWDFQADALLEFRDKGKSGRGGAWEQSDSLIWYLGTKIRDSQQVTELTPAEPWAAAAEHAEHCWQCSSCWGWILNCMKADVPGTQQLSLHTGLLLHNLQCP